MKIILSGGGTLGPVIPLLAIVESYKTKYPHTQFVWVGTKNGPERDVVASYHIPFFSLSSGKYRRYRSLLNALDIFKIIYAYLQSLLFLIREKPHALISCGGYVSVPLHWAAATLGIPTWVHQQDVRVGLANKLMIPYATVVTTALEQTATELKNFHAEWIGNPSRDLFLKDKDAARKKFFLPFDAPVIFALGGGTGSASVNKIILESLPHLPKQWHVIHLVGRERPKDLSMRASSVYSNYHVYEFFTDEMKDAYAVADVVVARAGFSTLTEIAALAKAAIIVPLPGTHQEDNAKAFADRGGVVLLEEGQDAALRLVQVAKRLVEKSDERKRLGATMHQLLPRPSAEKIVQIVDNLSPYI